MDAVIAEIRFAVRALRRRPRYVFIALLGLVLGIRANTAIFAAMDAMVHRPLTFATSDRILRVYESNAKFGIKESSMSLATMADLANATSLEGIAAYAHRDMMLGANDAFGRPHRVRGELVSWNLFSLLGVRPAIGRAFDEREGVFGQHLVAVISDKLWRETYGSDPGVIGGMIVLDGTPHTVIGIMPPAAGFPDARDVWTPIALQRMPSRVEREFNVVARLQPDATIEAASAELSAMGSRIGREHPRTNHGGSVRAIPLQDAVALEYRGLLWTELGAITFVLFIAYGNMAKLLLARATARQRELAVRTALRRQ
jgi:putative ABC transport system permease protein